jgi:hypothetical protein
MDKLDEIKNLWLSADTSQLPDAARAMGIIKTHRFKQLAKTIGGICMAIALAIVMIYVIFFYQSLLPATRIGEACMLIAIAVLLIINLFSFRKIPAGKNFTNHAYLKYAKGLLRHQLLFYRKIQLPVFLLASAGLLLYLYEGVYQQTRTLIIAYSLTIAFILVNWFILRPRAMRKKTKSLEQTIETLERLSGQLSEN